MGWEFDADGNVSNYDEFMEDQINKYNAAIDAYNGMSAEAQEELDKKYQDMKNEDGEYYSGYEDYLKQAINRLIDFMVNIFVSIKFFKRLSIV